jgi:hypothetical protein
MACLLQTSLIQVFSTPVRPSFQGQMLQWLFQFFKYNEIVKNMTFQHLYHDHTSCKPMKI